MIRLFRQFDIRRVISLSIFTAFLSIFLLYNTGKYVFKGRYNVWRFTLFIKWLQALLTIRVNGRSIMGGYILFRALFVIILSINLWRLSPYFFPLRAHVTVTIGLGLVMWLRYILISSTVNSYNMLVYLVPRHIPKALIWLIALVEGFRQLIRPLTLRIRLVANISAGHIILGLIRSYELLPARYIGQFIILLLEILVALIQAYVFKLLLMLYLTDSTA